jgi:hypothetical protein
MTTNQREERDILVNKAATTEPVTRDPRDTKHPTGVEQAAGNAANESPS